MDELEFALLEIGGTAFEEFTMDFLREQGYEVHESGSEGRDGGWDARVWLGDQRGIAHASKRKDWKVKLRQDAGKVEDLEEEKGEEYDIFVFVTNRHVSGEQELEIESEIEDKYGWRLRLYHQTNILGELRQNCPQLADTHLGVDIESGSEYIEDLQDLREDRLDEIQSREGVAKEVEEGPIIVFHVIPTDVFSHTTVPPADLNTPLVIGDTNLFSSEKRGKMVYKDDTQGSGYAFVRNDGLYETATSSMFWSGHEDDTWIGGVVQRQSMGVDAAAILTLRRALEVLEDAGYSGVASVSLSLLDAKGVKLLDYTGVTRPSRDPKILQQERYSTEFVSVDVTEDEVIEDIEPMLSEIWRQFGVEEGTKNIEDGSWQGGEVNVNAGTLTEGDR